MIRFFWQLRASKTSREVLKAGIVSDSSIAQTISQTQHAELLRLAKQIPLTEGGDNPATLAILLGGLSYLTLMAHNDQPMLGIDLRSEAGWQRVEEALQVLCQKLAESIKLLHSRPNHAASSRSQAA